jgi:hypothetical protein
MTKTMSVTELRKNIFDIIQATKINKQITKIMLHGEVVAEIHPKRVAKKEKVNFVDFVKSLPKVKGLTQEKAEKIYHDGMMKKYGKYLP